MEKTRKLTEVEAAAKALGLAVGVNTNPGRPANYVFVKRLDGEGVNVNYYAVSGGRSIANVNGRGAALAWLAAFKTGRAAGVREAIAEIETSAGDAYLAATRCEQLLSRGPWLASYGTGLQ